MTTPRRRPVRPGAVVPRADRPSPRPNGSRRGGTRGEAAGTKAEGKAGRQAGTEAGKAVARRLARLYPHAHCSLDFGSPFELLVATILSAQCTDKRVNAVTGGLFSHWPTAAALAAAPAGDLETVIRSTGFFRAKARSIRGCCQGLVERHGGEVPRSLDDLVRLPGVGRKTANVVLGSAFGQAAGVVVDTHVGRISRRLGLTRQTDPVRVERDLMAALPRRHWIAFSHRLIEHGRTVCTARRPRCEACPLADLCPRVGVRLPTRRPG